MAQHCSSAAALVFAMCIMSVTASPYAWQVVTPTTVAQPVPRQQFAMGYTSSERRVVVFGGKGDGGALLQDTWVFAVNSSSWSQVAQGQLQPEARFSMVSGCYSRGGEDYFVITSGEGLQEGSRVFYNDVWRLTLSTYTWSSVVTSGPAYEPRYGSAGGIFPGHASLVLSHGFAKVRYQNTFKLDLATDTWEDITPAGDLPFNRCLHAGAATQDDTISIATGCGSGGYGPCPAVDAWTLKASGGWQQSASPCAGPRLYMAMAQAAGSNSTVVTFGGKGSVWGAGDAGVVATWDTASDSWARFTPQSDPVKGLPAVRFGAGMVRGHTSTGEEAVIMFAGGESASVNLNDLWLLTGTSRDGLAELDCPSWFDLRILHGVLMFLAWGLILPLGITIARFGRLHKPQWFWWHRRLQYTGVILSTAGLVVALLMVGAGKFAAVPHSFIGLFVAVTGLQQPVNAFFRPEPPHEKTRRRVCWERYHKYGGRLAGFLGIINPFWGFYYLRAGVLLVLYSIWVFALVSFWVVATLRGLPGPENPSPVANKLGCLRRKEA